MRSSRYRSKAKVDEVGGGFAGRSPLNASTSQGGIDLDLYAASIPPVPPKHHRAKAIANRAKARQLAEPRLIQISDDLQKLADEVRYLNPVMAELLDEAWDAAEEAIDLLSTEESWYPTAID